MRYRFRRFRSVIRRHLNQPAPRRRLPRRRRRVRRGFTLIELLVALVLLDLALLALVASSAVAARRFTEARTRSRAVAVARSRVEWASTLPCGQATSGTDSIPGVGLERWTISAPAAGVREIIDTVELTRLPGSGPLVHVTRDPC